jgi:hypothetical protein
MPDYPFLPKTNAAMAPGQFWSIPLSDGRFACGRVIRIDRTAKYGARTMFVGGLLDWVGAEPPTAESIAGRPVLEMGNAHVMPDLRRAAIGSVPARRRRTARACPRGPMMFPGWCTIG